MVISPLFFVILSFVVSLEVSTNIMLVGDPKPDPFYGGLRIFLCLALFFGASQIVVFSTTHGFRILEFAIVSTTALVSMTSIVVSMEDHDFLLIIAPVAFVVGLVLRIYGLILCMITYPLLKKSGIKLKSRSHVEEIWTIILRLHIPYILAVLSGCTIILSLNGYL